MNAMRASIGFTAWTLLQVLVRAGFWAAQMALFVWMLFRLAA